MNFRPIMWAQRQNVVLIAASLGCCKYHVIQIEPKQIYLKGIDSTRKKHREVIIKLYKEIVPQRSLKAVRDGTIKLILRKKDEKSALWPQLTKRKLIFTSFKTTLPEEVAIGRR